MTTQRSQDDTDMDHAHFPETRKLRNSAEEDCRLVNHAVVIPASWLKTMHGSLRGTNGVALLGHIHNARMADYMWALAINQHSSPVPL